MMDEARRNPEQDEPQDLAVPSAGSGAKSPSILNSITAKLSSTFLAMAALTAIACIVAWIIFTQIERSVDVLTSQGLPEIALALKISETSASITATAPAIIASETQAERQVQRARLDQSVGELSKLIARWRELENDSALSADLTETAGEIENLIDIIDQAEQARLGLAADLRAKINELSLIHDRFLEGLEPQIDDALFNLVIESEQNAARQADVIGDLVDTGANNLLNLVSLRAEGNLAVGILNEAANVINRQALGPLGERFDAAAGQMRRAESQISLTGNAESMKQIFSALIGIGQGPNSIFSLRRQELEQHEAARRALDDSRERATALSAIVADLVSATETMSNTTANRAQDIVSSGKMIMILISAASILGALLMVMAYISPRLVRPIESITHAMGELAAGDTSVEIPGRERSDELGKMAQALGVFRDITIEVQRSNLREIETARRRLSDAIESISEAFSLYDSQDKLVVYNEKYGSLVHPEIADKIHPGMSFEEILHMALEEGFLIDAQEDKESWLKQRLERHNNPGSPHIMQRPNGVWIMVSERKTSEGGTVAVYSDITELKERENELAEKSNALENLSSQLSKYLSPQVYQSIFTGEQSAVVATKRKKLTIFFSDLARFTETAERLESEDLTQLLNEYLTEMSEIALAHGATIDKYIGDAIMIFFGDPVSRGVTQDALNCARMAVAMQTRLREMTASWSDAGLVQNMECRMGIATGFCNVGNFGSENRMDYTIIGGAVNLASRLEMTAKPGSILISEETYNLIKDEVACEELETVQIKGIAHPVKTFQITADHAPMADDDGLMERLGPLAQISDPASMSREDREHAAKILRNVLRKLDSDGKD